MVKNYKIFTTAAVITAIGILSVYLLANSMLKPVSSDEQMYCTGAYLISKGLMIYRDFSYVAQLPCHPLLCAAIYKLTDTTYYLLTARLASVVFDILTVICIFSIISRIFRPYCTDGVVLAIAGAAMFVFNPYSSYLCGLAWNHDMVLLCIILSFRIFLEPQRTQKPQRLNLFKMDLRIFLAASLLTIAVWTRATTFFVMTVFLAMTLINTESFRHGLTRINTISGKWISALAGITLCSIWPAWIALKSSKAFLINIFTIPILNAQLLHKLAIAHSKTYLTIMALRNMEFLLLLSTAVLVWGCVFCLRRKIELVQKQNMLLCAAMLTALFITAYIPPTMWKQYLGLPVPFMIIFLTYGLLLLKINSSKLFGICRFVFIAMTVMTVMMHKPQLQIIKFLKMDNWTPINLHQISKNIATETGKSNLILTLSPLYAIEGSGEIYTELSAGAFAFRVADRLSQQDKKNTHTAGVSDFRQIILTKTPAAVIIGPELTRFEKIDLKSLVPQGWQKCDAGSESIHLFMLQPKK